MFNLGSLLKILSVELRNYRCLRSLKISLDQFSALIGANGTGKSAALHGLDWFFNGGAVDEFDFHVAEDGTTSNEFSVAVELADLPTDLAVVWARYVRHGTLSLRRTATRNGRDQLSGLHNQGPGFQDVRLASDTTERRRLYRNLRAGMPELPHEIAKAKIELALEAWESDPANDSRLIDVDDADLTNAFGFYGKQLLSSTMQFVLVPASARLEENVDPTGKGGAIDALLGSVVRIAAEKEVEAWAATHGSAMEDLAARIGSAVQAASLAQMDTTNRYLDDIVAGGRVSLVAAASPPRIKPEIGLSATFEFEGSALPIARQGHGVQRSVMMAALQAAADLAGSDTFMFLAIEEPELYQHPARSMALSRALSRLALAGSWQILIATHSPSFLRPESAASVRRFSKSASGVTVVEGSVARFAAVGGFSEGLVQKHLETLLPSDFSSALFADRVLLVEGASDQIVLGRVLELRGIDVDARNWAIVNCGGKGNLPFAAAILKAFDVDVRVVFDADCRGDARDAEHRRDTENLLAVLVRIGVLDAAHGFVFGGPTVAYARVGVLTRDIEHEELAWPSFMAEVALSSGSTGTATKNPYIVRSACASAELADCPPSLVSISEVLSR